MNEVCANATLIFFLDASLYTLSLSLSLSQASMESYRPTATLSSAKVRERERARARSPAFDVSSIKSHKLGGDGIY